MTDALVFRQAAGSVVGTLFTGNIRPRREALPVRLVLTRYERRRLQLLASLCRGSSVLDVGHAQMPNPFLQGMTTTGVDTEHNLTPLRYGEEIVGDVFDLHRLTPHRQFDNVILGEFIEHVEQPYDLLRFLRAFIKPEGQLLISTPNPVAWPTVLFEWLRSRSRFYSPDHTYYFTPRWMHRVLERCSYKVLLTRGVGFWLPGIIVPCSATLSYQVIYQAAPR